MATEVTHQYDRVEKRMVQLVSPRRLREILDRDGDSHERPKDFAPDDEWIVDSE